MARSICKVEYRAAKGANFNHAEAAVLAAEQIKLGNPSAAELVRLVANKPQSPFHKHIFVESELVAAQKWREHTARRILNHIAVIVTYDGGDTKTHRAFYAVHAEAEATVKRYVVWSEVEQDDAKLEQVVADTRRWLESFVVRFRQNLALGGYQAEFGDLFTAIEELLAEDDAEEAG